MNRYPEDPGFEKGSDTSEAAAEAAIPTRATMQRLVLGIVRDHEPDGITCDRVEAITGGAHQTISARIRDLVLNGSIYDTGDRRPTRRNRKAVVYRIKTAVEPYRPTEGESQERLW